LLGHGGVASWVTAHFGLELAERRRFVASAQKAETSDNLIELPTLYVGDQPALDLAPSTITRGADAPIKVGIAIASLIASETTRVAVEPTWIVSTSDLGSMPNDCSSIELVPPKPVNRGRPLRRALGIGAAVGTLLSLIVWCQAPAAQTSKALPETVTQLSMMVPPTVTPIPDAGAHSAQVEAFTHTIERAGDVGSAERARSRKGARSADARTPRGSRKSSEGRVTIDSNPWASLFIDGAPVGPSPLVERPMAPGEYRVIAIQPNGKRREHPIKVYSNRHTRLLIRWTE
jgi:hypothetical protein